MDKNVLDKEENYMKIEYKIPKYEITFKDLAISDVFQEVGYKYTYMKIQSANQKSDGLLINAIRLNDGELMFMHSDTPVCQYEATLTIQIK